MLAINKHSSNLKIWNIKMPTHHIKNIVLHYDEPITNDKIL